MTPVADVIGTPTRPLPELTELNRSFWTSGRTGRLHLQHCRECDRLIHPPALLCPDDHSPELDYVALGGRAVIESWTENLHGFLPGFPSRYIIAYVTPVEDDRVRILTNIVNGAERELTVGMPVRVLFERREAEPDDIYVPLFEPAVDG